MNWFLVLILCMAFTIFTVLWEMDRREQELTDQCTAKGGVALVVNDKYLCFTPSSLIGPRP